MRGRNQIYGLYLCVIAAYWQWEDSHKPVRCIALAGGGTNSLSMTKVSLQNTDS